MSLTHLTPEQIASYTASALPEAELSVVERHLLVCESCRDEVVDAGRFTRRWPFRFRYSVVLPAAAVAALLIGVTTMFSRDEGAPIPTGSVLRSATSEGMATFEVIEPEDGSIVPTTGVVFRWHAEEPDPHYRIHVMNQLGELVWEEASSDTSIQLPPQIVLSPDQSYFWYVDALLRGVRSSTTGVREFSTDLGQR
jgi:hypothetical protein